MSNSLQLYGALILTMLAFVLPILAILLSLFSDGVDSLAAKYKLEKKQSDDNLVTELKKKDSNSDIDYKALQNTIKTLKHNKRKAELRLGYLKPIQVAIKISIPFAIAFLCILTANYIEEHELYLIIVLGVSLVAFFYGLYTVWNSLSVITEVADAANRSKRETYSKIIELLSTLVEKSGSELLFIPADKFRIDLNNKHLKEKIELKFSVNKKYDLPVSLINNDIKMGKVVEAGLIFPSIFLIESKPTIHITPAEKTQIVRYKTDAIQAHETQICQPLGITFMQTGDYDIPVFVKGENVKYHRFNIKITVIE